MNFGWTHSMTATSFDRFGSTEEYRAHLARVEEERRAFWERVLAPRAEAEPPTLPAIVEEDLDDLVLF